MLLHNLIKFNLIRKHMGMTVQLNNFNKLQGLKIQFKNPELK